MYNDVLIDYFGNAMTILKAERSTRKCLHMETA